MKEVLEFFMNGAQSLMDPRFFKAQVKLQREKCLAVRKGSCLWLGPQQIAELRKHLILVVFADSATESVQ